MDTERFRSDHAFTVMTEEMDQLNADLQNAVHKVSDQNTRFEFALNNMFHALSMFDEDQKLVIWNQRFLEIFKIDEGAFQSGCTLYECITQSKTYSARGKEYCMALAKELSDMLLGNKPKEFLAKLPDGRTLKVSHEPMEGKGSVQTIEDITERLSTEKKIRHMAHHDALTGLPNRVLFNERLEEATTRNQKYSEHSAILCLDLDHFKEVNDTLGHAVGDQLLVEVSHRIKEVLGAADTFARLGGDEFAIIQNNISGESEVEDLATLVVEEVSTPFYIDGNEILIGTSIGIVICGNGCRLKPYELLRNADLALYSAKAERNGFFHFYRDEMAAQLQLRKKRESELRLALSENHFEMYYQPQVSAEDKSLVGIEALIRWNHPVRGRVSPSEFIDLSEEIGLITPMTEFALRSACTGMLSWPDIKLSVNLSPLQFRKPGVFEMIQDILMDTGFDPERLELEITEGALLLDSQSTLVTLEQLKSLGISIAMDDFGTGYSSLSYLRSFPFDKLKIDQSFIKGLGYNDEANSIVQAVINLGKSLGMRVNAEGVENHLQADILRLEGCDELQGYYFGKPMIFSELEDRLGKSFNKVDPFQLMKQQLSQL